MNKGVRNFIQKALPHLSAALSLMLIVLVLVHLRNPFMGFLTGKLATRTLIFIGAVNLLNSWYLLLKEDIESISKKNNEKDKQEL